MSVSSTALLLSYLSHAEPLAKEQLPAVGSFMVQMLSESCSNRRDELRYHTGGCIGNTHPGSHQGQLSELLVTSQTQRKKQGCDSDAVNGLFILLIPMRVQKDVLPSHSRDLSSSDEHWCDAVHLCSSH